MVCDKKSCTSSTRRATRLAQKSHPKFWPSDFELLPPVWCIFCPVRPSGSYVSCDDLQEPCVSHIGSFCVPWHCSLISQSVQRLGTFAWSATPLSFTWWHRWPSLGDGFVVCQFMLCARHFVLPLWVCLQICPACASSTNTSCTMCVSARTNRAICSSQRLHGEIDNHVLTSR